MTNKHLYYLISCIILFIQSAPSKAQLIINEVMANPNGSNLPPYEYIELLNNSAQAIELSTIELSVNNNRAYLPAYILAPQQYILLCSQEAAPQFARYGNVLALPRWFILPNSSGRVTLIQNGADIDQVNYKDSWHSNTTKKNGGWSLERINPNWVCDAKENWTSSFSPSGGTPGRKNTALNKNNRPNIFITDVRINNKVLEVSLNQPLAEISTLTTTNFEVDKNIGIPKQLDWDDQHTLLTLTFDSPFQENEVYLLKSSPFIYCSFRISFADTYFTIQPALQKENIIITEILFNPKQGGFDFVEIYNRTLYPVNLKNWQLGNRTLSDKFLLIEPHNYMAFTVNKSILLQHYPTAAFDNIIEVPSLPPYPNQQGNVLLYDNNKVLMDSIYYNATMHDPLYVNVKGISLERQSLVPTHHLFTSFGSSASIHEGATPGYANSIGTDQLATKNKFILRSKTVSPNDDNFEDNLEIQYTFDSQDYYLSVNIYNDIGVLINRLIRHEKAGTTGEIRWNARNETGQKVKAGYYIIIAEIYSNKGRKQRFKEAFLVVPNSLSY